MRHKAVVACYQTARNQDGLIYTTDYVLDETFTLLFKRLPFPQAQTSLETLTQAVETNHVHLVWMTPHYFAQTQAVFCFLCKLLTVP
jgi:uncharacterized protein